MSPERLAKRKAKTKNVVIDENDDDLKEWAELHKCEDCSYEKRCQKFSDRKTEMPKR